MRPASIGLFSLLACNPDAGGLGDATNALPGDGSGSSRGTTVETLTDAAASTAIGSGSAGSEGVDTTVGLTSGVTTGTGPDPATTGPDPATTGTDSGGASTGGPMCGQRLPAIGGCEMPTCDSCPMGVCNIDCTTDQECAGGMTITCAANQPCLVTCNAHQACQQATIVCPADHACEVSCVGEQACQQANIQCANGPCTVTCDMHNQACDDVDFDCGADDSILTCLVPQDTDPTPTLSGSPCACEVDGC